MQRTDGKITNMDEVIAELIEFWKTQAEAVQERKTIGADIT